MRISAVAILATATVWRTTRIIRSACRSTA